MAVTRTSHLRTPASYRPGSERSSSASPMSGRPRSAPSPGLWQHRVGLPTWSQAFPPSLSDGGRPRGWSRLAFRPERCPTAITEPLLPVGCVSFPGQLGNHTQEATRPPPVTAKQPHRQADVQRPLQSLRTQGGLISETRSFSRPVSRFTPTHVGTTPFPGPPPHPPVRFTPTHVGTTRAHFRTPEYHSGSPPHTWGRRRCRTGYPTAPWFTPTHVGTTCPRAV